MFRFSSLYCKKALKTPKTISLRLTNLTNLKWRFQDSLLGYCCRWSSTQRSKMASQSLSTQSITTGNSTTSSLLSILASHKCLPLSFALWSTFMSSLPLQLSLNWPKISLHSSLFLRSTISLQNTARTILQKPCKTKTMLSCLKSKQLAQLMQDRSQTLYLKKMRLTS